MDTLLAASRERAWSQVEQTLDELERAVSMRQQTPVRGRPSSDPFAVSLRRDNLAMALKQLSDLRRRVHAHHLEALREDIDDIIYLGRRAALNTAYFNNEFDQALAVLEVADAELLYETSKDLIAPLLVASVSDALLVALAKTPRLLYEVSSRKFEEIVAELFHKEGFEVELTQATRDKGVDIIAVSRRMNIWQKVIVECKRYAPENRVGIAVVQRLLGVKTELNANKAVVVTTSSFSKDAATTARERFWDLDLKAYNDVVAWLRHAAGS
jgi:restriction endonuclease Mrr